MRNFVKSFLEIEKDGVCLQWVPVFLQCTGILLGSGYGYGTVPGGRWAIDTEGGHVVVSVSLN